MADITKFKDVTNWIFDRLALSDHPWSKGMSGLEMDDDAGRKALCGNWRMDHRVSKLREQNMLGSHHFPGRPVGEELLEQWSAYCRYVNIEHLNENNLIKNPAVSFDQLVHVGSFNRILWELGGAEYGSPNAFGIEFQQITNCTVPKRKVSETYKDSMSFNKQVDDLVDDLQKRGKGVVKEMSGLLCDVLASLPRPWWACFAEELTPYIQSGDWAGLCKTLGLGHFMENEWVLIWQYDVGSVRDLYRPTVIEADVSPYHYPSPPSSQYGITMPLGQGLPICREVVHRPLTGTSAIDACTGELCKIQGYPTENYGHHEDVPRLRCNHRDRLESEFTSDVDQDWIERHNKLI